MMKQLKGIAASYGTVQGKVRIILSPKNNDRIKEGEILVTKYTNPLFTPAIIRASAIVTDSGGKTCHGAIIARELGIPCVVGSEKATKVLKDGLMVIVDGEQGVVYYEQK